MMVPTSARSDLVARLPGPERVSVVRIVVRVWLEDKGKIRRNRREKELVGLAPPSPTDYPACSPCSQVPVRWPSKPIELLTTKGTKDHEEGNCNAKCQIRDTQSKRHEGHEGSRRTAIENHQYRRSRSVGNHSSLINSEDRRFTRILLRNTERPLHGGYILGTIGS
jgi:hypothetical protein